MKIFNTNIQIFYVEIYIKKIYNLYLLIIWNLFRINMEIKKI